MKHFRTLSLAVVAAVAVPACSSGSTPVAETDTLTIMAPFFSTAPPERDDNIETGARTDRRHEAGDRLGVQRLVQDKTNVTLAGDDLPHVMVVQGKDPAIVKNAEAGAFWDLTDYLRRYPNLATTLPEVQHASSINGRVLGDLPRARRRSARPCIVRKDWLDERWACRCRETTEDLYTLAKAFTDPGPGRQRRRRHLRADHPEVARPDRHATARSTSSRPGSAPGNRWTERDGRARPQLHDARVARRPWQFERQLVERGAAQPGLRDVRLHQLERAVPQRQGRHHHRRPLARSAG